MEQWVLFLGRFHPLFIHLPIGILVALVVLEISQSKQSSRSGKTTDLLLWLVFAGALMSVLTGLMLEQEGGYSTERIFLHKILGIAMTAALGVTALLRLKFRQKRSAYLAALGLSTILMILGSHQGGILTHGKHFLTENAPWAIQQQVEAETAALTQAAEDGAISYTLHIRPLMEAHCVECHNAEKMKADLRLDSYEAIMKGSKFGPVVVPGDPEESTFYYLTTFPEDDPDRMPKDGEPLTTEEKQILHDWIAQGAVTDP